MEFNFIPIFHLILDHGTYSHLDKIHDSILGFMYPHTFGPYLRSTHTSGVIRALCV